MLVYMADFWFTPSQWETVLLCNDISHWLGASLALGLKSVSTVAFHQRGISSVGCACVNDEWCSEHLLPYIILFNPMGISIRKHIYTHDFLLTHTPHCYEGVQIMFMNRPWAIHVLVMNIHNPFMHCATSRYVFEPRDVIMLMHDVTIVAA